MEYIITKGMAMVNNLKKRHRKGALGMFRRKWRLSKDRIIGKIVKYEKETTSKVLQKTVEGGV